MKKGLIVLLLTLSVFIFPSITIAVKKSDRESGPSSLDAPLLKSHVVSQCIECH